MGELRPGNEIDGLAVIEAPNTTLFVPHGWHVRIDEHDIYWLTQGGQKVMSPTGPTAKAKTKAVKAKAKAADACAETVARQRSGTCGGRQNKPKAPEPAMSLKQQLTVNDSLFGHWPPVRPDQDEAQAGGSGHLRGGLAHSAQHLQHRLGRRLQGVLARRSQWRAAMPSGSCICRPARPSAPRRGIISHPGLLSQLIRSYIENGLRGDSWLSAGRHL